jgi:succinate dehydrogenase/fumarate reductase flavoprotein subunit
MYAESNGTDQWADMVVLGTGPGGMAAVGAAIATDPKIKIIAVEACDRIGGNAIWSTGWVAFVDSEIQRKNGIKDTEKLFVEDCRKLVHEAESRYAGTIWDLILTRRFARESSRVYDILVKRGVNFTRLIKRPLQASVDRLAEVGKAFSIIDSDSQLTFE